MRLHTDVSPRSHSRVRTTRALAAAIACTVALSGCVDSGTSTGSGPASTPASPGAQGAITGRSTEHTTGSGAAATPARVVRVTSDLVDGQVVGVGMPVVLNFSPTPTDPAPPS